MKTDTANIIELYQIISDSMHNIAVRRQCINLRKNGFESNINKGFKKVAFDTRRIDQETEYNPRRGLQTYNRSEQFLSKSVEQKLINVAKLKTILDGLKNKYGKEPEWQDSNVRVLLNTINSGIRSDFKDEDYTDAQRGTGSLDYIEELLDMRYRLRLENISKMADSDIKGIILGRDEDLVKKDSKQNINDAIEITKRDVATQTYDSLMEKLFGGIRATKENPNVERTVTITIKDKFVEDE